MQQHLIFLVKSNKGMGFYQILFLITALKLSLNDSGGIWQFCHTHTCIHLCSSTMEAFLPPWQYKHQYYKGILQYYRECIALKNVLSIIKVARIAFNFHTSNQCDLAQGRTCSRHHTHSHFVVFVVPLLGILISKYKKKVHMEPQPLAFFQPPPASCCYL